MYIVPKYEPKIRVISKDGSETVYKNLEEFLKHNSLHFIRSHVVTTFKEFPVNFRPRIYLLRQEDRELLDLYIVRDEFGSVFSAGELIHAQEKRIRENPGYSRWRVDLSHHVYRQNPVPHTGKNSWSFGHYYRRPKTTQEMRWAIAHEKYVRGRRSKRHLPSSWDDVPRSDIRERKNWKRNRKTQWK